MARATTSARLSVTSMALGSAANRYVGIGLNAPPNATVLDSTKLMPVLSRTPSAVDVLRPTLDVVVANQFSEASDDTSR